MFLGVRFKIQEFLSVKKKKTNKRFAVELILLCSRVERVFLPTLYYQC